MIRHIFIWLFAIIVVASAAIQVAPSSIAQFSGDNNKIGVHLISPTDDEIRDACRSLVNINTATSDEASGGKLTLTLVKNHIDKETLQRYHDIAREEGCVFIHPIKNSFADPYWKPLDQSTIDFFEKIFKDLRPSSKYLYVVLGNEVNRGDEWGGTCDGATYARIAKSGAEQLKKAVPNIQIGLAGLDAYAPQSGFYCSQESFLKAALEAEPRLIDDDIDFQVVHEYPNADMTGSLQNIWLSEKRILKNLGVSKDLPVVISEIAWRRHRGLTAEASANKLYNALQSLEDEPSVWAITPFVYKFCGSPFDQFSLLQCNVKTAAGNTVDEPNAVFDAIAAIPKIKGDPEHIHGAAVQLNVPQEVIENTDYTFTLEAVNKGTDIWRGISGDYELKLFGPSDAPSDGVQTGSTTGSQPIRSSFTSFHTVKPDGTLRTKMRMNPGDIQGCPSFNGVLMQNGRVVLDLFSWQPCIVPHPDAVLRLLSFPGNPYSGVGEIQIFDINEKLVFRQQVSVSEGVANVPQVRGVRFEGEYRIVWLSPGNLPVQITNARFHKGLNEFKPPMLLPLDSNKDGALSLSDILQGFK